MTWAPYTDPETLAAAVEHHALAARLADAGPAPCQTDTDVDWFAIAPTAVDRAVTVCRQECAARAECLAYAVAAGEWFGVWGGSTAAERRALHLQARAAARTQRDAAHQQVAA